MFHERHRSRKDDRIFCFQIHFVVVTEKWEYGFRTLFGDYSTTSGSEQGNDSEH